MSISKGMSATGSSINNHGNNANKNGNTSAVVANGSSQKYGTTNPIANVKNLNILVTGSNNAGIYVGGGATPATANIGVNSEITVSGTNSTGIYNQGTVNINDNNKITGIGGTTGIYSDGGTINNSLSKVATININDTTKLPVVFILKTELKLI